MKYILMIATCLCLSSSCLAQFIPGIPIDSLRSKIDLLESLDRVIDGELNIEYYETVKRMREFSDYLYFYSLQELTKKDTFKESRIAKLREISNMPFYSYRHPDVAYYSQQLYIYSIRELINEYKGDLKNLESIKVYPAFYENINLFLRNAIIDAGGKWTGQPIRVKGGGILDDNNNIIYEENGSKND